MKNFILFLCMIPYILWCQQEAYIQRYAKMAQQEQAKYGIPASVILAQAILESNSGESMLAIYYNNHFGISCQLQVHGTECSEYLDRGEGKTHYFKVYSSVWASYRDHSVYLTTGKYASLKSYCKGDWKKWCTEIPRRGYSVNRRYAELLVNIIDRYNLHERFDSVP